MGAFKGVAPQQGLGALDQYLPRFAKVRPDDPRLVRVAVLMYDTEMQAPSPEEAKEWVDHFGLRHPVLVADPGMIEGDARALVPGFHLIDKGFVLRAEDSKRPGKVDLWSVLLPMVGRLVNE